MRRLLHHAALLAALAGAAAACKGDHKKCEAACRNHFTLVFNEDLEAELAKAPETCPEVPASTPPDLAKAQADALAATCIPRDKLRAKRMAEFPSRLENGVNLCIEGCQSAGNDDQIDCLNAAKTAKAAKACLD